MISLGVRTLDSQTRHFSVPSDYTVRQFKEHIAESVSMSPDSQRLIFYGRVLQNDQRLAECNVEGNIVHLVERAPPPFPDGPDNVGQSAGISNQTRRMITTNLLLGSVTIPRDFVNLLDPELQVRRAAAGNRLQNAMNMIERAQNILTVLTNRAPSVRDLTARIAARVNANLMPDMRDVILTAPVPSSASTDGNVDDASREEETRQERSEEGRTDNRDTRESYNLSSIVDNYTAQRPLPNIMAVVLDDLESFHARFFPFVSTLRNMLRTNEERSNEDRQVAQHVFNSVTEIMHHLSHAYHSLSDITFNFNDQPPRYLACRYPHTQAANITMPGARVQTVTSTTATTTTPTTTNENSGGATNSQERPDDHTFFNVPRIHVERVAINEPSDDPAVRLPDPPTLLIQGQPIVFRPSPDGNGWVQSELQLNTPRADLFTTNTISGTDTSTGVTYNMTFPAEFTPQNVLRNVINALTGQGGQSQERTRSQIQTETTRPPAAETPRGEQTQAQTGPLQGEAQPETQSQEQAQTPPAEASRRPIFVAASTRVGATRWDQGPSVETQRQEESAPPRQEQVQTGTGNGVQEAMDVEVQSNAWPGSSFGTENITTREYLHREARRGNRIRNLLSRNYDPFLPCNSYHITNAHSTSDSTRSRNGSGNGDDRSQSGTGGGSTQQNSSQQQQNGQQNGEQSSGGTRNGQIGDPAVAFARQQPSDAVMINEQFEQDMRRELRSFTNRTMSRMQHLLVRRVLGHEVDTQGFDEIPPPRLIPCSEPITGHLIMVQVNSIRDRAMPPLLPSQRAAGPPRISTLVEAAGRILSQSNTLGIASRTSSSPIAISGRSTATHDLTSLRNYLRSLMPVTVSNDAIQNAGGVTDSGSVAATTFIMLSNLRGAGPIVWVTPPVITHITRQTSPSVPRGITTAINGNVTPQPPDALSDLAWHPDLYTGLTSSVLNIFGPTYSSLVGALAANLTVSVSYVNTADNMNSVPDSFMQYVNDGTIAVARNVEDVTNTTQSLNTTTTPSVNVRSSASNGNDFTDEHTHLSPSGVGTFQPVRITIGDGTTITEPAFVQFVGPAVTRVTTRGTNNNTTSTCGSTTNTNTSGTSTRPTYSTNRPTTDRPMFDERRNDRSQENNVHYEIRFSFPLAPRVPPVSAFELGFVPFSSDFSSSTRVVNSNGIPIHQREIVEDVTQETSRRVYPIVQEMAVDINEQIREADLVREAQQGQLHAGRVPNRERRTPSPFLLPDPTVFAQRMTNRGFENVAFPYGWHYNPDSFVSAGPRAGMMPDFPRQPVPPRDTVPPREWRGPNIPPFYGSADGQRRSRMPNNDEQTDITILPTEWHGSNIMDFFASALQVMPFEEMSFLLTVEPRKFYLEFGALLKDFLTRRHFQRGFERHLLIRVVDKLLNDYVVTLRHVLDSPMIREDIDLVGTICTFNQANGPGLLECIMSLGSDADSAKRLSRMLHLYLSQLATLFKSSLIDVTNLRYMLNLLLDESKQYLPNDDIMWRWLYTHLFRNVFLCGVLHPMTGLPDFLQRYLVYRMPQSETSSLANQQTVNIPKQRPVIHRVPEDTLMSGARRPVSPNNTSRSSPKRRRMLTNSGNETSSEENVELSSNRSEIENTTNHSGIMSGINNELTQTYREVRLPVEVNVRRG